MCYEHYIFIVLVLDCPAGAGDELYTCVVATGIVWGSIRKRIFE